MSPSTQASRRDWIGLAVITLPCLLYSMDLTVLNLALPSLSVALSPSSVEQLWIVDIYGFTLAGALIPMGALGDRIGRRKLLLLGAAAFGALSVLAAFSVSAGMLIATRALLGVAGATLAPSTLSLIRNMFADERERTTAIGIWATSYAVGAAVGPLLGGLLLQYFWWGSAFLIGVPVMALLLLVGPVLLPEFRDPDGRKIDLLSASMSLCGVLSVIYALKQTALHGLRASCALLLLVGIALGMAFVRRQRRIASPLIDLALFRRPAFVAALTTNSLCVFVTFGTLLTVAQYLQLVLGLSPLSAGLWTVPFSGGFIVGSILAPLLVRRLRAESVLVLGLSVGVLGSVLLSQISVGTPVGYVVAGSAVLAVGIAPVLTLSTDRIVGFAPPERAGAAAALSETGAELGGALGIAVLGSVVSSAYRLHMTDWNGAGLSEPSSSAVRDSLSGALAAASELPVQSASGLLARAREGFTTGLHFTAVFSAVFLAGLALLTVRQARSANAGSLRAEDQDRAGSCL
ncbi:MAG TPA: MFS transporter [Polyangiaceae bacterium]|nr:MFS transporter [Polyangiaceae bacterium]